MSKCCTAWWRCCPALAILFHPGKLHLQQAPEFLGLHFILTPPTRGRHCEPTAADDRVSSPSPSPDFTDHSFSGKNPRMQKEIRLRCPGWARMHRCQTLRASHPPIPGRANCAPLPRPCPILARLRGALGCSDCAHRPTHSDRARSASRETDLSHPAIFEQPTLLSRGQRQTLGRAARFHEFIEGDRMREIAARGQQGFCFRTAAGSTTCFPTQTALQANLRASASGTTRRLEGGICSARASCP